MKKLSIISACALFLGLIAGPAMAQAPTYSFDIDPTDAGKNIQPGITISPGVSVTFDIYLSNTPAPQNAGGFWVDFSGSTADVAYVSAGRAINDGSEGPVGDWPPGGVLVNEPAGVGTIMGVMADLGAGAAPDGDGDLFLGRVTLQSISAVDANVTLSTVPSVATWTPIVDSDVVNGDFFIDKEVECIVDADCPTNNDLWCDGWATCEGNECIKHDEFPCSDGNDCTLDICEEAAVPGSTPTVGSCTNPCDEASLSGPTDDCCLDLPCSEVFTCGAQVVVTVEPAWGTPGDVGVKVDLCLDNRDKEVGAFQVDICEEISGEPVDCLECVGCEMTERTVLFDCFVYELEDGCCRVILISKHPGGVINPGICSVVKIDYTLCGPEDPDCECNSVDCIDLVPANIVIADPYGNPLAPLGESGEVCPFECGDVDPGESAPDAKDCGDGDVDLVDIITEVNFALGSVTPDDCQFLRGDVPTGTPGYGEPPYCTAPDGTINVLDVMVLIDMALDRQDCCTYYYTGGIY